jgi:hypothetical protein
MKKIALITLVLSMICLNSMGQDHHIMLWPAGQIPNYKKSTETEKRDTSGMVRVSLVQEPDIRVYLPAKSNASGQAVVICPGGGMACWRTTGREQIWPNG